MFQLLRQKRFICKQEKNVNAFIEFVDNKKAPGRFKGLKIHIRSFYSDEFQFPFLQTEKC